MVKSRPGTAAFSDQEKIRDTLEYLHRIFKKDERVQEAEKKAKKEFGTPAATEKKIREKKEQKELDDLSHEIDVRLRYKKDKKPLPPAELLDIFAIGVLGVINEHIAGGVRPVIQVDNGPGNFPVITPLPGASPSGEVLDVGDQGLDDPLGLNAITSTRLEKMGGVELNPAFEITFKKDTPSLEYNPALAPQPAPSLWDIPKLIPPG